MEDRRKDIISGIMATIHENREKIVENAIKRFMIRDFSRKITDKNVDVSGKSDIEMHYELRISREFIELANLVIDEIESLLGFEKMKKD